MRGRTMQVLLTVALLLSILAAGASATPVLVESPFVDVPPDHPQIREFSLLKVLDIFEGYPDGRVRPEAPVTRLQFVKVAVSLAGERDGVREAAGEHPDFRDGAQISPMWWGWVNISSSLGLVHGYEDGTFRPRSNITFAEAVAVLLRVAGYEPFATPLDYPYGYLRMARQLGLTAGVELAPSLPITRYEMAILAVNALQLHPPDERGQPAADPGEGYRPTRLERWPGRVEGVVSSVSDGAIVVDEREHPLADEVHLFGASSLADLEGHWITGHAVDAGIAYLETVEEPVQLAGRLQEIDVERERLRVDDRWFRWVPGENSPTTWRLNGTEVSGDIAVPRLASAVARDLLPEVQLVARAERVKEIEARFWDAELYVLAEAERDGDGWLLPVGVREDGRVEHREIQFPPESLPEVESGEELQTAADFRPGLAIRGATREGAGMGEGEVVDSALFFRLEVTDAVSSGAVEELEAVHDDGDLYFSILLGDGSTVLLSEERLLGAPEDISLNELYRAEYLRLIVGRDDFAVAVLDARIAGPRAKYVWILTVWKFEVGDQVRSAYIVVDERGEARTYELSHPSRWALFVDESLQLKEDRLGRIEVDEAGRCEGVISWVAEEPLPGEYAVSYVDAEEGLVTVRRVRERDSDATPNVRPREVLMAMNPAVYTPDGEYLGLDSLSIGQRVRLYPDEEDGEVALLETIVD